MVRPAFIFLASEGENPNDAVARCTLQATSPGPMGRTVRPEDSFNPALDHVLPCEPLHNTENKFLADSVFASESIQRAPSRTTGPDSANSFLCQFRVWRLFTRHAPSSRATFAHLVVGVVCSTSKEQVLGIYT